MIIPSIKNQNIYIVGLGKTGLGAIKTCIDNQAHVFIWDDNPENIKSAIIAYPTIKALNPIDLPAHKLDAILVSPGIPIWSEKTHSTVVYARDNNIKIISDFELLFDANPDAFFIGITGTNGKSTTTALIEHILKTLNYNVAVGGNIGISVLDLPQLNKDGVYILESSSFQLDLLNAPNFDISLFLNLTPDHIDRHLTLENYKKAKTKIFANRNKKNVPIISIDYPELNDVIDALQLPIKISTSQKADVSVINKILYDNISKLEFNLQALSILPGQHNDENIAFAYAACLLYGAKPEAIIKSIYSFTPLAHRSEPVILVDGLNFINDSKATNADSTEKALLAFKDIIWIAGGVPKEGGIKPLNHLFPRIKKTYLIGKAQDEFANTLSKHAADFEKCGTLENALRQIKREGIKGTVLLSPACASYDQYKNYEERGNAFKELVQKIFVEVK